MVPADLITIITTLVLIYITNTSILLARVEVSYTLSI